ncbi:MAG: chromate transporter [Clostridiales bacterium]|nr:chromate transporter [Clostridiales bacterium]
MSFLTLLWTFFKIGLFTFGGGYAMIPLIQEEVVNKHHWIEEEELINFIAVSESTPGPFAINIATYVGNTVGYTQYGSVLAGILGAVCSTFGVVLPSLVIIILVAKFYEKFKKNKIVEGCMSGLRPAAIGLIASVIITLAITTFFGESLNTEIFTQYTFYLSLGLTIIMTMLALKKVNPILLIVISAAVGIVAGYITDMP